MLIRGVRGATTAAADTEADIRQAVIDMMDAILEANTLLVDQVITLFITVTDDLHAISPARIIREHYAGWQWVPILCAKEPDIDGLPVRCIRLLIQYQSDTPPEAIRHVYQGEAKRLRPDRQ
jgi:chorismate mutase